LDPDPTQPDNTVAHPEQTQTDPGAADNTDGVSEPASEEYYILDTREIHLFNSTEGADALLNGQPV
jgi:hypothetical protein